jgi:hypothetical protein
MDRKALIHIDDPWKSGGVARMHFLSLTRWR